MKRNIAFDDKDKKILTMFSQNPNVSQEVIGEEIGMKQPSVAVRIRKLREAGALEIQAGVDPFRLCLQIAKVDVTTSDPGKVLKLFNSCPYFMNGLIISGKNNLSLFFVAENISTLESIVDGHLRRMPEVQLVDFNIVISAAKKMIMPVDLVWEKRNRGPCEPGGTCKECESYKTGRCTGCPMVIARDGWFF
ncbi:MAG: Lrp/AsnC family transcriptional regulator [Candidatus Thermoplasmatota archaeon]|nr:Lrp/AsnC family transcriptional regulator [Euryarchaeota archaeon]MBU4031211.1 Lrp/AsnC family transcriptional regulator [Candidatus Thermoplasmatota archaeon]MBU4070937.1 Lrp/AsnC family transcriptional regulator [Candidatus Thermoplasmatota archaeon]MBU4144004.1 Lrp/AsnC family transcriptional regulator [Candidatus Thermoplasmatota archaeon]MBU4591882.1 Lrp/AsnC family transcriptional regulator [Candidatus Thermoplasmatota archaeon]